MSLRSRSVNEEIEVELKVKIKLTSVDHHNVVSDIQVAQAIQEFKDEIKSELKYKLDGEYRQELLRSVHYVEYEVTTL